MPSDTREDSRSSAATRGQRLFVAVLLPAAWVNTLTQAQEALRGAGVRLRFVRAAQFHLTLRFFGDIPTSQVKAIADAIALVAQSSGPFTISLGQPGAFGPAHRPRVIWIGIEDHTDSLARLHRSLELALARSRIAVTESEFNPHLTLARVPTPVSHDAGQRISTALRALRLTPTPRATVDSLSLIESHLAREGAQYETIAAWPLSGAVQTDPPSDHAG